MPVDANLLPHLSHLLPKHLFSPAVRFATFEDFRKSSNGCRNSGGEDGDGQEGELLCTIYAPHCISILTTVPICPAVNYEVALINTATESNRRTEQLSTVKKLAYLSNENRSLRRSVKLSMVIFKVPITRRFKQLLNVPEAFLHAWEVN